MDCGPNLYHFGNNCVIAFFVLYGLYQGWGYYQTKQSLAASELYQSIVVLDEKNTKDIMQKAENLIDHYGGTPYAGRAAILFAKASYAEGLKDKTKEKLEWASSHAKESATESIALIQLGQILVEEKKYEEALADYLVVIQSGRSEFLERSYRFSANVYFFKKDFENRVFDPFFRLQSNDQQYGSGLGLALVQKLRLIGSSFKPCVSRIWLDP